VESEIQTNLQKNTALAKETQKKGGDKVLEKGLEELVGFVLDKAEKHFRHLPQLRSYFQKVSPTATVVVSTLDLTDIGTYAKIYQKELVRIQENVRKLDKLYDQYERYRNNQNLTRNLSEIKGDIAVLRSEIGKQVFNLNLAAEGIETEKELGSFNCYNVLRFNNQLMVSKLNELLSKPIE
jgi:hypothetical protein